ncbi:MAG: DUF1292 domain-containing protein [Candidatus Gastranaerophilales bacterium]|nr:DUF1292 domain-containing protein [Candidatus Gastranaerophilales bacterium]
MNRFDDMDKRELQIITTVGENGEEVKLKLLDIVTVNDFDYALLLPIETETDEVNEEESEVILMRLKQDASEYVFETIEDDEEFNLVAEAILDEEGYEDVEDEEE